MGFSFKFRAGGVGVCSGLSCCSIASIIAVLLCGKAFAGPESLEMLVDVEKMEFLANSDFYDGEVLVDFDGDGVEEGVLYYSYSKLGGAPTCLVGEVCAPEVSPFITFYFDLPEGRSHVDFMCESIGLYQSLTNRRRDLLCGPRTRLRWDGQKYAD